MVIRPCRLYSLTALRRGLLAPALGLVALWTAAACAAAPTAAATPAASALPRPYAGRRVCCDDPAQFRFTALPDGGRIEFDLDRTSPIFEFQNGYSVFRAFRLPVLTAPYLLEVRSYIRGGPEPDRAQVLYPMAALLTDDYLVTRSIGVEALAAELPILERTSAPAYRLSIPVDPVHGRERYLVLFTPQELVSPGRERAPVVTVETAAEAARDAFLGASSEGHLSVTVVTGKGDESLFVH